jgi:hypothetical protein
VTRYVSCLLLGLSISAVAAPSNDDMARCAAIAAPDARLACYDTLAHRPVEKIPHAAATPPASSAPAQTPVAAAPNPADPRNFGLEPTRQRTTDLGPKSIAAHIAIVSANQTGQTTVVLDTGQVWTVIENDGRLASGDAVTIKRAALGSFLMMTPSNRSYQVRRIK